MTDQSFSDFPLLAPSSPDPALGYLKTINELSDAFLRGDLRNSELLRDLSPDQGKFAKGDDGKMVGENGSVILHLLGKQ